jgi:hypothetical protein
MEDKMKYWTIAELSQLTRSALLDLEKLISTQITTMPEASNERREALEVLANIRVALTRPMFAQRRAAWKPPAP